MHNPLAAWLARIQPIPERFYTLDHVDTPESDWPCWLSIEECRPLHEVLDMQWLSLQDARKKTQLYLTKASELINGLEGGSLDSEEQDLIRSELGDTPMPSLPIYLITCGVGDEEELVYVGKTKNTSRFNGGHSAALKLHAPEYQGKAKHIYRCTAWFAIDTEYISLDWIQPESLALDLLDSLESQLIFWLQPPLNTHKKKQNLTRWEFPIHIQNRDCGGFMNDEFI